MILDELIEAKGHYDSAGLYIRETIIR
eukprot:SAG22_NODE_16618_length_321_cov_1.135135_1_plen_26_part_01